MYRQTRSDIASPRYRLFMTTFATGLIVAWVGLQHIDSLPVFTAGTALSVVTVGKMYSNRSIPIPELTAGQYVPEEFHDIDELVAPESLFPTIRQLLEDISECDEVEEVFVRPLPEESGQMVEIQLSGGRVSDEFARVVSDSNGEPRMRDPTSDEYYRLFLLYKI